MSKDAEIFATYMSRRGLLAAAAVTGAGVAAAPLLASPAAASAPTLASPRSHPIRGQQADATLTPILVSTRTDVVDTTKGTVHMVIGGGGTS
ncbi:MAG TPA: hypothetical protein VGF84_22375, partial [Micromonosporaceae bacterium]